jgi:phosphonate transport system substrate-binding protein
MHKNILFVSATILIFLSNFVHASAPDKLHFGIPPIYSDVTIKQGFTPVMKHLSRFIGTPVELVVSESYESLVEDLKSGKVQFAILGPALYVQATKTYPKLKYLATTQTTKFGQKRAYYYGHIIVNKDSDMKNISDLKGKGFAYVSEHSTSGYRFPRLFFTKRNINPDEYFDHVVFAGSHSNVTDMIAQHELEVGVTYDINLWDAERKHGKLFRTIAKIGPIVDLALVANHRVSDNLTTSIVDALTSIPEEYLSSNFPYTGVTVLSDSNYDLVRDVIAMKKPDTTASKILEDALKDGNLNAIYDALT